jgi:hypothetical protein
MWLPNYHPNLSVVALQLFGATSSVSIKLRKQIHKYEQRFTETDWPMHQCKFNEMDNQLFVTELLSRTSATLFCWIPLFPRPPLFSKPKFLDTVTQRLSNVPDGMGTRQTSSESPICGCLPNSIGRQTVPIRVNTSYKIWNWAVDISIFSLTALLMHFFVGGTLIQWRDDTTRHQNRWLRLENHDFSASEPLCI